MGCVRLVLLLLLGATTAAQPLNRTSRSVRGLELMTNDRTREFGWLLRGLFAHCRGLSHLASFLVVLLVVFLPVVAFGGGYPSRPVRVFVGSASGGAADTSARLAADALSRVLDSPVIVELHGGAGGLSAVEAFLATEPDGHTILLAAVGSFAIIPAARHVSYDVAKDFVPLGMVWRSAQALAVPLTGAGTLADFIAEAKARPATVTIGSAGVGTLPHLTIELLKREAGIKLIHVPFRGTGAALPALIGGQINGLFIDAGVIAPQVKAGILRAVAVASDQRAIALPDVPTTKEVGVPGVAGDIWFGLVASARTPPAVLSRLQEAVSAIHTDPAYRKKLAAQQASAGEAGPKAFADLIASENAKWRVVVSEAGIKFE
jgi:tripartite-type tricarboxylate transporter receptor subunit TctC